MTDINFNRCFLISFCLLIILLNNYAAASIDDTAKTKSTKILNKKDTTKNYGLPKIEIYGTRNKSNSAIEFSPNTQIGQKEIETIAPVQLSEVLIFSPGVNIRNYGGIGAMKTISIRGTGSSRTLILLDGMPISSSQNSSFDLNNISVSMIDNIEIVRGGASTIFGGNAIGGAVNIQTNAIPREKILANFSYASFNELGINITGNYVSKHPSQSAFALNFLSVNANYQNSKGDFPFTYNYFGKDSTFRRENADFENGFFSISGKFNVSNWSIWTRAFLSTTDKGVPDPIIQGNINQSKARFEENNYLFLINSNRTFANNSNLRISGIAKKNKMTYIEPKSYLKQRDEYDLNDFGISAKYNFWSLGLFNEAVADFSHSTLAGDNLALELDSFIARTLVAVGYRIEKELKLKTQTISLNAGTRIDKNDKNPLVFSAALGGIYQINKFPVKLRTNFSHNFRFPNFNEMYYRNFGSKDLLPEKSNNFNVGISADLIKKFNISVDGFWLDAKDMIVAIPTSPISWQAANLDKAVSRGLEFSIGLLREWGFVSDLNFSYTLQQTLDKSNNTSTYNKQLPYIPKEYFSFLVNLQFYKMNFGMKGEYSSFQYTQADNAVTAIIPSYFVCDLFIYRDFRLSDLDLQLRFDCKNLLDERYEIISNYLMPSRQYRLTFGLKL